MTNKTKVCWYCGSTNVALDSSWIYDYKWKEYEFEVYVCDEEDNWCEHSWTIYSPLLPKKWLEKLYEELK